MEYRWNFSFYTPDSLATYNSERLKEGGSVWKGEDLQLLVEKEWALETINSLGAVSLSPGLSGRTDQPALVTAIRSGVVVKATI